jgi:hypothetical protein
MTVRRRMLTPPRQLILSLVYPGVRVYALLWFVFPTGLMRLMTVRYWVYMPFYLTWYDRQDSSHWPDVKKIRRKYTSSTRIYGVAILLDIDWDMKFITSGKNTVLACSWHSWLNYLDSADDPASLSHSYSQILQQYKQGQVPGPYNLASSLLRSKSNQDCLGFGLKNEIAKFYGPKAKLRIKFTFILFSHNMPW